MTGGLLATLAFTAALIACLVWGAFHMLDQAIAHLELGGMSR